MVWNSWYDETKDLYCYYSDTGATDVWEELYDAQGTPYYYNPETHETLWELPEETVDGYKSHDSPQDDSFQGAWLEAYDENGYQYFTNSITGESVWTLDEIENHDGAFTANEESESAEINKVDIRESQENTYNDEKHPTNNNGFDESLAQFHSSERVIQHCTTNDQLVESSTIPAVDSGSQPVSRVEDDDHIEEFELEKSTAEPSSIMTENDAITGVKLRNGQKDNSNETTILQTHEVTESVDSQASLSSQQTDHIVQDAVSEDPSGNPNSKDETDEVKAKRDDNDYFLETKDEADLGLADEKCPTLLKRQVNNANTNEVVFNKKPELTKSESVSKRDREESESIPKPQNSNLLDTGGKRSFRSSVNLRKASSSNKSGMTDQNKVCETPRDILITEKKDYSTLDTKKGKYEAAFNDLISLTGNRHGELIRRSDLFRLLVERPVVFSSILLHVEELSEFMTPKKFFKSFLKADENKDGFLDKHEFLKFCDSTPIISKKLVPYRLRKKLKDRPDSLLITIPIEEGKGIDKKLGEIPYCIKTRRAKWDNKISELERNLEKSKSTHERKLKSIREQERRVREKWEIETERNEEKERRSRKIFKARTTKENHAIVRSEGVTFLQKLSELDEAQESKKNTKTKRGVKLRKLSITGNKVKLREVTEVDEVWIEKNVIIALKNLDSAKRQQFFDWFETRRNEAVEKIEAKINQQIAKFIKEKRRLAKAEAKRRKKHDKDIRIMLETFEQEYESCSDTIDEEYSTERDTRGLEDKTYKKLYRQRQHFLEIAGRCRHRPLMRRLRWLATLSEKAQMKTCMHLVVDSVSREKKVMKTFPCETESQTKACMDRANLFKTLSGCRYLIKICDVFHHRFQSWNQVFILEDYCTGKTLNSLLCQQKIFRFSELWVLELAEKIAYAVLQLHNAGMVHCGISPWNIFLLPDESIKLSLPIIFKYKECTSLLEPNYTSPEIFMDPRYTEDEKSDVWSLGAIVFYLMTGSRLEPKKKVPMVSTLVSHPAVVRRQRWLRTFLRMTLQPNPTKRATIQDCVDFFYSESDAAKLRIADPRPVHSLMYE